MTNNNDYTITEYESKLYYALFHYFSYNQFKLWLEIDEGSIISDYMLSKLCETDTTVEDREFLKKTGVIDYSLIDATEEGLPVYKYFQLDAAEMKSEEKDKINEVLKTEGFDKTYYI